VRAATEVNAEQASRRVTQEPPRQHSWEPEADEEARSTKPHSSCRGMIRDRVAATATALALEPVFEADPQPKQCAYRYDRSAPDAMRYVRKVMNAVHAQVVKTKLSSYFDVIPHAELLRSVLSGRRRGYAASGSYEARSISRGNR